MHDELRLYVPRSVDAPWPIPMHRAQFKHTVGPSKITVLFFELQLDFSLGFFPITLDANGLIILEKYLI